ncbi:MAG: hypothetical protein GQ477_01015 [Nanohaloarchaea archaeon]|nr:hypothetical protein [Candidatus Nanohaloarchaea archaeon]
MNDWELIMTMIGEKATTDITISKDSKGLKECKDSANEGGMIAQHTRKELEAKTGKSLMSDENYLHLRGKKKKSIIEHKK